MGIAATDRDPPDHTLAITAFRKAYRLDPRRKFGPRGRRPAGLFEVPTRLARVYRKSGRFDQAQKTYEWILRHHDSVHAKVGLAAVREDRRRHSMALELYEEVLGQDPYSPGALRGKARTLASLDWDEEVVETYNRAEYYGGSGRQSERYCHRRGRDLRHRMVPSGLFGSAHRGRFLPGL